MSEHAPVEVALLGCDHPHSNTHLDTLVTLELAAGIHLWDPDPAVANALRERRNEPKIRSAGAPLDDLLGNDRIVWLLVCLRNDLAPEVLLRCAAAGKPVLAEKPMGRSLAEVEPVVAAFRAAGVTLTVCFQNRYKPGAGIIRELAAQGAFGRLCVAETRLHTTQVRLRNPKHWLFSHAAAGSGILSWLGCHYLDLLRFVMQAEVVSVAAHCGTLSGEAIDVEDVAALSLAFDNGVLATASFGYLMPTGQPGYISPGYDSYLGLKGTLGSVGWEPGASPQVLELISFERGWAGAPQRELRFAEEPAKAYGGRYGLDFARDCLVAGLERRDGPTCGEDMLAVWTIIEAALGSPKAALQPIKRPVG